MNLSGRNAWENFKHGQGCVLVHTGSRFSGVGGSIDLFGSGTRPHEPVQHGILNVLVLRMCYNIVVYVSDNKNNRT